MNAPPPAAVVAAHVRIDTSPRPARPAPAHLRLRDLVPAALVVALSLLGPTLQAEDECAPSDGPQFRCWLLTEQR